MAVCKVQLLRGPTPVLHITSYVVNVIRETAIHPCDSILSKSSLYADLQSEIEEISARFQAYPTREDVEVARWRTLIENEADRSSLSSEDYGNRYMWYRQAVLDLESWFPDDEGYNDPGQEKEQKTSTYVEAMQESHYCSLCLMIKWYFGVVSLCIQIG